MAARISIARFCALDLCASELNASNIHSSPSLSCKESFTIRGTTLFAIGSTSLTRSGPYPYCKGLHIPISLPGNPWPLLRIERVAWLEVNRPVKVDNCRLLL